MSRERRRGLPCRAMAISLGRKQWEAFDELEDRKNTGGGLGGGRHRLYRRGRRAAEGDQNPDQYLARRAQAGRRGASAIRSEEHTSELQSLMRISSAVFCLKQK